ncbi:MAG: hypothetical protein P9L99_21625 [Candidatus Lernaella stagnicola]|nr:hypothetical protein [Candidatus Lernaella stagnicola]
MRKLVAIMIVAMMVFAASSVFAAGNEVKTKFGALALGGTVKTGLTFYVGDEVLDAAAYQAKDRTSDFSFTLNCFVLKFGGWVVDERITYVMNLYAKSNDAENMGVQLLDAIVGFHYIPYTGIYVGHMRPMMTYFNSLPVHMFKTIDQPLMNRMAFPRTRQTGLNFGLVTPFIDANLGVYNGRQFFPARFPDGAQAPMGNVTYFDQNTGKDIHFGVIGKPPVDGLKIRANLWYGTPVDEFENDEGELIAHNASVMFINGGVDYLAPFGLTLVAEVLYGNFNWDENDPALNFEDAGDRDYGDAPDLTALTTMSYYFMAGYNFGPMFEVPLEIVARYDYIDPDTENDEDYAVGYKDAYTDIVAGLNYYIKGYHAMLSLNYTYHGEEWEDVNNKAGDDKQDGISNDEVKLQAQVAF